MAFPSILHARYSIKWYPNDLPFEQIVMAHITLQLSCSGQILNHTFTHQWLNLGVCIRLK